MSRILRLFALFLVASSPAFAQADNAAFERMERLEHDIQLLQKQVARGETPAAPVSDEAIAGAGGPAQLEVRLTAIQDELRSLRGKVEEVEFQNRRLNETFEKFQKDTEFRFGEMSKNQAPAISSGLPEVMAGNPEAAMSKKPERKPIGAASEPPQPEASASGGGFSNKPGEEKAESEFATPRDHYNHAFRLLNQTKYEEAAKAFAAFTKKYPKDPLIGNAYYWQGETFYIRRDYVGAADSFRQGFEALPAGPKAADNLLKLAMSLDALDQKKEACVVLGQVIAKFKKTSVSIADKAGQEQKRMGCGGKP